MKENYGDLETLEVLGKESKNNLTVDQLLNPLLKNKDGESNIEVRKRMLEFLNNVLEKYSGEKIAIVSHGAAIKFLIQNWCEYDYNENAFLYNGKFIFSQDIETPSIIKIIFCEDKVLSIEKIVL